MRRPSLLVLLFVTSGCAPSVKRVGYTPADLKQPSSCPLAWQTNSKLTAAEARELGRIKIGDTGFSKHCSEPEVRAIVERDACGLGAQVVDIERERRPSALGSTCYRVDARLLALSGPGPQLAVSDARFAAPAVEQRAEADHKKLKAAIIAGVIAGVVVGLVVGLTSAL